MNQFDQLFARTAVGNHLRAFGAKYRYYSGAKRKWFDVMAHVIRDENQLLQEVGDIAGPKIIVEMDAQAEPVKCGVNVDGDQFEVSITPKAKPAARQITRVLPSNGAMVRFLVQ